MLWLFKVGFSITVPGCQGFINFNSWHLWDFSAGSQHWHKYVSSLKICLAENHRVAEAVLSHRPCLCSICEFRFLIDIFFPSSWSPQFQIQTQGETESELWNPWISCPRSCELWFRLLPYRHVERGGHCVHAVSSFNFSHSCVFRLCPFFEVWLFWTKALI